MAVLTCPQCGARFLIADSAMAPDGRKVKCSACTHTWTAFPEKNEEEDDDKGAGDIKQNAAKTKPIPEGIKPTKAKKPKKAKKDTKEPAKLDPKISSYLIIITVFFAILALFLALRTPITNIAPSTRAVYSLFGVEPKSPAHGLVFDKVDASIEKDHISIKGNVINLTDKKQKLPKIEAVLKDGQGKEISTFQIEVEQKSIGAQETIGFSASINVHDLPQESSITVRFDLF